MSPHLRSKKMALFDGFRGKASQLDISPRKMVRIGPMASAIFPLDRRELMAGLGAAALSPVLPASGLRRAGHPCLQAQAGSLALRPGGPETPVWSLQGPELRFKRGDDLEVALRQRPAGTRGARLAGDRRRSGRRAADRPAPLAAGARKLSDSIAPRRHLPVRPRSARRRPGAAGARRGRWWSPESEPVSGRSRRGAADRGLAAAGRTAPRSRRASDPKETTRSIRLTANLVRTSQREPTSALRLRFINGCQRSCHRNEN